MSKTQRKTPPQASPAPSVGAATEEAAADQPTPEQVTYDPASGCLLRVFWMLLGNVALLASAYGIVEVSASEFGLPDVIYWAVAASLLGARYADVQYMNGRTADGQPATMAHWRRYAAVLVVVSTCLWIVSHVIAHFSGD